MWREIVLKFLFRKANMLAVVYEISPNPGRCSYAVATSYLPSMSFWQLYLDHSAPSNQLYPASLHLPGFGPKALGGSLQPFKALTLQREYGEIELSKQGASSVKGISHSQINMM